MSTDTAATALLSDTGELLAGLLTAGLLADVQSAAAMPEALFPDLPPGPERDRALFQLGARVGYSVGYRRGQPRWDPTDLATVRQQLHDIGYDAMAGLMDRAVSVAGEPAEQPEIAGE